MNLMWFSQVRNTVCTVAHFFFSSRSLHCEILRISKDSDSYYFIFQEEKTNSQLKQEAKLFFRKEAKGFPWELCHIQKSLSQAGAQNKNQNNCVFSAASSESFSNRGGGEFYWRDQIRRDNHIGIKSYTMGINNQGKILQVLVHQRLLLDA